MRRHSPARSIRPPPKRRGRVRSLSPLSRSQPAPPGEEHDRKPAPWDASPNRNKRFRSRSRSREWMDRPIGREPSFLHLTENERSRGPPRDKNLKGRDLEKSRDRNRERDRPMPLSRDSDLKDGKLNPRHPIRHSPDRILNHSDDFEESYLDNHQLQHYGGNIGMTKNHNDLILDPSSITFNTYASDSRPDHKLQNKSKDLHKSPRITRQPSPRDNFVKPSSKVPRREKEETSSERINRLEKLVEKLVEGNVVSSTKSKEYGNKSSKDAIPELIPSNTKFTTSMWLNSIHEECLSRNFDEKSSIRFLQDQMTGIIKAWFKTVSNYDFTWPELKLLITKTFPDNIEFIQTLKLLVARDKTAEETITQYFFSKVYLCEACKISGENAVSCLIDGLSNPFMKQDIKSHHFITPEALYSDYLSKFPENEHSIRIDRREVREVIPDYQDDSFIRPNMNNIDQGRKGEKSLNYPRGEQPAKNRPRPLERKKCFTCKKFGHATVDCRHAPICYVCKKKGHIAANCHFNDDVLLISSHNASFTIPESRCLINGSEFYGIIDTGSVAVTLKEQLAEDLGLKCYSTGDILSAFNGAKVYPLGETKIELSIGSAQRLVKALIIRNEVQQAPVIVGQEFLSQEGILLCQKNGRVDIFDEIDKE